ncbi:MAG TPA: HAD family acid phosphatase [Candidatus Acidoferrum sp.]|nr:HAD family acid phosphatase [Candidatus Acidoferrum sp.]
MIRIATYAAIISSFFALAFASPAGPTYEDLNAVLWFQTSVEYQASAAQTYHSAETALLRGLRDPHWTSALEQTSNFEKLPPAVILDLDETVLDNSPYEARLVATGEPYSEAAWTKWANEENAGLVPGAMHFLKFARAKGVATIYITNRTCDAANPDDTLVKVLHKLELPTEPIAGRLFCSRDKNEKDKTARRAMCAAKFRILLLFGDQLGDFLQIPPESATLDGRQKLYDAHQAMWGERWFQLPNPMYGSWETAAGHTLDEKLSHLKQ